MKEKALRGTKFRQKLKLFGSDKLDKRGRNQMLDSQHARQFVGSVHLWLVTVRARRSFFCASKTCASRSGGSVQMWCIDEL